MRETRREMNKREGRLIVSKATLKIFYDSRNLICLTLLLDQLFIITKFSIIINFFLILMVRNQKTKKIMQAN